MVQVWKLNGKYEILSGEELPISPDANLDQISKLLPGGAYTTFRTYDHYKIVSLENHFLRLEETAALAGQPIRIDYEKLRGTIREIVHRELTRELRIRITLDLQENPGLIYLSYEPLVTPAKELYETGANAETTLLERHNPKAKLTDFIVRSQELKSRLSPDLHEILMVNSRREITEGLTSNFFGVLENKIFTAEEGVLLGITRSALIEEAQGFGFEIVHQPVRVDELPMLEEAFITSTSRLVLPIRAIDQQPIGNGIPGVVTKKLMELLKKRIVSEYEEI